MEEGDYSVDQSVEAKVQREAIALQNVSGSTAPTVTPLAGLQCS